jgi:hypothetical protein
MVLLFIFQLNYLIEGLLIWGCGSQESSFLNFTLDVSVELLPRNGLSVETSNGMDDLPELVLVVAVF